MPVIREALDVQGTARLVASPWVNTWPLYEMSTTSAAQTVQVAAPYYEVPYTEEVFQKLAKLPDKAPDLPYDGDDDL